MWGHNICFDGEIATTIQYLSQIHSLIPLALEIELSMAKQNMFLIIYTSKSNIIWKELITQWNVEKTKC